MALTGSEQILPIEHPLGSHVPQSTLTMEGADNYWTITAPAETAIRERSSKFLAFAYPVQSEEQIRETLDALRKRYFDATHHCYAWRLGAAGADTRANDDGEPSGTAGRPILGQMLSCNVTDCLVVVVRYFGGTKLGVSGLIAAYKESAAEVLAACKIVERTVDRTIRVLFPYLVMNDIMRVIKEEQPAVREQIFDNLCTITLSIRESRAEELVGKLAKAGGTIAEGDN